MIHKLLKNVENMILEPAKMKGVKLHIKHQKGKLLMFTTNPFNLMKTSISSEKHYYRKIIISQGYCACTLKI